MLLKKRLKQDASLGQRTSLPVEDLIDLLSFCLNTPQFAYNGTYYQQVFGTAMGSVQPPEMIPNPEMIPKLTPK